MPIPKKLLYSLEIASKRKRLAVSLSLDPITAELIPTFGSKKSKILAEVFLFSDSIKDFIILLKKLGYGINPIDEKLALAGKLEEFL
jgi:hypothetical protein